ncbi:MAG: hypothetical protein IPJ89_01745 [Candidatus Iainarchaeum archaeon]|uniref:Gram-positive cocci surface proteins LPxTG domain-containing protein n=1 Tax=Candidatus Iainarchaeum sp. TaxID=3101447 RepID=A0A7T9DKE0_9ARCH|nr:MAG: hypothetical protein IPJ89_01745 [Candidatus Diapherotrites archaeon]
MKVIALIASFLVLAMIGSSFAFAVEDTDSIANQNEATDVASDPQPSANPQDATPCANDVAATTSTATANDQAQATPCPTATTPGTNPEPPVVQPTGGNGDPTPNPSGHRRSRNNENTEESTVVEDTQTPTAETTPVAVAPTPTETNPRSGSVDPVVAPGAFFTAASDTMPVVATNDTPAPDTSPLTGLVSTATNPLVGIGLLVVLGGLYLYTRRH